MGRLEQVLERSKSLGFLGPGSVTGHLDNARAFVGALPDPSDDGRESAVVLDLGSGGGVPGLVIAHDRTDVQMVLVDAGARRAEFLHEAVSDLEFGDRVRVVRGRAEDLARDESLRGRFDVVTARSFGPPPVTVECAVGFLRGTGSRLLVSEPPDLDEVHQQLPERWPTATLATLGLHPGRVWRRPGSTIRQIDVIGTCPDRFPRRVGVPARRPLY